MNKGDYISTLLRSDNTIFSFKETALLWGETSNSALQERVSYYVRQKKLIRLRPGLYAKDKEYDRLELAVKILVPAYVSFESVLGKAGIIFQSYKKIFVASYATREIKCDAQIYSFKKIKDEILLNPSGIEQEKNYSAASPERAFLDTLYLNKNYHFDNLSPLDQKKIFEILPIYKNKRMNKAVEKLFKDFNQDKS